MRSSGSRSRSADGLTLRCNTTWDFPDAQITTVSEDPNVQFVGVGLVTGTTLQGEFIGDYTAIAIGADFKVHPTWTDFRGKPGTHTPNQGVYT